ncbi:MAG: S-adenosylmethionine:tRNA ribosyltransferase-isomerase [Bacteroidetes bacterium]|nr:S-adenosylmethionine:tRNA ribosyltransferase-isomerase [Bacteroidota bacterium]
MTESYGSRKSNGIDISDYNYDLPEERIAQYPVKNRDMSKLLIYRNDTITDTLFRNIDDQIPPDHLLIFNNTKVVRARLNFQKDTGAAIEVFCIEPLNPPDYERSFGSNGHVVWKCIVGNLKKWKKGKLLKQFQIDGKICQLSAEKINQLNDACEILFSWDPQNLTFANVLEATGHIPLPPYINREDKEEDSYRYQTIYAQIRGSVAAPTAGLHFTEKVLEKIGKKGIKTAEVTLHVGAGTFQPIKTQKISEHEMHCEHFVIRRDTIERILESLGKVIAVGTTSVRTLESLYWIGVNMLNDESGQKKITVGQWEPYNCESNYSAEISLNAIISYMENTGKSNIEASTSIMIVPGYKFRIIDGIITNFHQPCSTLLLLVSALTGDRWKEIYKYALENDFRFLSYEDSSLLFR